MGAYTSAIVATVATVATTATSFAVMAEEDQKKRLAEEAAANLMEKASKKLDVNYYEQLNIEKEAYEVARRNLLAQGATATETLREGDPRALAAGVGRVQLAQQMGQEKVSLAQQQEQSQLDKLVAGEESRLRDLQTQLDLQGAIGAQQASADAERASQMALQQGMAGVVAVGGQVAGMVDLYQKTPEARSLNQFDRAYGKQYSGQTSQDYMSQLDPNTLSLNDNQRAMLGKTSIGGMSSDVYKDFMGQFSSNQIEGFRAQAGIGRGQHQPLSGVELWNKGSGTPLSGAGTKPYNPLDPLSNPTLSSQGDPFLSKQNPYVIPAGMEKQVSPYGLHSNLYTPPATGKEYFMRTPSGSSTYKQEIEGLDYHEALRRLYGF